MGEGLGRGPDVGPGCRSSPRYSRGQELASPRPEARKGLQEETPAERGARLWAQARQEKPRLKRLMARALAEMGVEGEPIPFHSKRR